MLSLGSCERTRHDPPPARPAPPSAAPTKRTTMSARLTRPPAETVVAIGDLHGDLSATRRALKLAGAIDDDDRWVGGKLIVVQTGDVLDRGDEDRGVLDLLERLRDEAKRAGGELLSLAGNHEIMNVMGDFRYITQGGLDAFGGAAARLDAFRPGGRYALKIAERPIYVRVGDTVFVHGGAREARRVRPRPPPAAARWCAACAPSRRSRETNTVPSGRAPTPTRPCPPTASSSGVC